MQLSQNVFEGENNVSVYLPLHRRHHCPHGTTRIYKTSGVSCPTTEYLEKYPTYGNALPPQSLKPKQELQACHVRMEGVTTFKNIVGNCRLYLFFLSVLLVLIKFFLTLSKLNCLVGLS